MDSRQTGKGKPLCIHCQHSLERSHLGGGAKFVLQEGEQNVHLLMKICTMGICSGGVLAYTPSLWLSISFNFLMLPCMRQKKVAGTGSVFITPDLLGFCRRGSLSALFVF